MAARELVPWSVDEGMQVPVAVVRAFLRLHPDRTRAAEHMASLASSKETVDPDNFAAIRWDCLWSLRAKLFVHTTSSMPHSVMFAVREMTRAPTLLAAIEHNLRFLKTMFGNLQDLKVERAGVRLNICMPLHDQPTLEMQCHEMDSLSMLLATLNWLTNTEIAANAHFRGPALAPSHMQAFLFPRPAAFDAFITYLSIPGETLDLPIVRHEDESEQFIHDLVWHSAFGSPLRNRISDQLRLLILDEIKATNRQIGLEAASYRLGRSPASLRRDLAREGTSFRQVRDDVLEMLCNHMRIAENLSISRISERLGFAEPQSFRRWRKRLNGQACDQARPNSDPYRAFDLS